MSRKKQRSCILQAVQVKGRLQGLLGEITIAQTYQNAESVNIEAVFTFPVPVEAVLLGVEICINDRELQGRVLPKRQAEETYEDAVSGGDSAVLVQEAGRGLYTVNVGNLLPGETARLTYRYALLHVWNGHTLRFHLPLTIAPRYGNPLADGLQPHQIPQVAWNWNWAGRCNRPPWIRLRTGSAWQREPRHCVSRWLTSRHSWTGISSSTSGVPPRRGRRLACMVRTAMAGSLWPVSSRTWPGKPIRAGALVF